MRYTFSLLLIAMLMAGNATAQDKIRLRNGDVTEAKVVEVNPRQIIYKRWDNQTGPDYRVNRGEVVSIQYQNGSMEDFGRPATSDRDEMRADRTYGRNILSVALLQFNEVSIRGIGLYFERAVDRRGIIAVQLPVTLAFPERLGNNNGYNGVFTSFYPGLKIYPRGNQGVVKYAVGPSLAFGFGRRTGYDYNQFTGQTEYRNEDVFQSGVMVNNSLNISPTEHLYMGLEFGLGFKYTDNQYDYYYGDSPLVNFNFKIGYRF